MVTGFNTVEKRRQSSNYIIVHTMQYLFSKWNMMQQLICVADDVEDTAAMPESRAVVSRLQRQMLSLLPHYCISDLQQHQHRLRLAAAAAVAASDPLTAACVGNPSDLDDTVAQMEMNIYDVLSNIVTLCTSLVTQSGELNI